MPTKIQFKRGTNTNFGVTTLSAGEPAFITDTGKFYIGDGTNKILINEIDKPSGLDTINSFTKFTVNDYGQIVDQENLVASDIPDLTASKITDLGTAALADVGTASGNIPVLDSNGKLATSTIPSIAITDVFVVNSESEMLALDCQVGDIAIRSDINETFILKTAPSDILANWVLLETPTDSVLSVNGETGVVVLDSTDILMTGYVKAGSYTPVSTSDSSSGAIGKLEKNFDNYATINSPNLTGSPTAPTPNATENSTIIATTGFVQNLVSVIDGGLF